MASPIRCMSCLVLFVASFSALNLSTPVAQAQTANFQYVSELGGYLDQNTGLVWGEQVGITNWDGAVRYASNRATTTGKPWRLPTVAECQTAAANGICNAIPSTATGRSCWTADSSKKKGGAKSSHYVVVFLWLPSFVQLYSNTSLIDCIAVYKAF